jgi:hypothetical protein
VLTSGLLVSTFGAAHISKYNLLDFFKLFIASFSIGIVQVFYVNKGIYKALIGQPMQWFMLKKNGNAVKQ